jgi:hypothetical protein
MTVKLSKWQDSADAFVTDHPIGSTVTSAQILQFATRAGDGLAPDLLLPDPAKQISNVVKHLNHGAESSTLPEAKRFHLVEASGTGPNKTWRVTSYADYAFEDGEEAYVQSVTRAVKPLDASIARLSSIKPDELSDGGRQAVERQLQDLTEFRAPMARLGHDQLVNRETQLFIATGVPPEVVDKMKARLPAFVRLQKAQKLLAVA